MKKTLFPRKGSKPPSHCEEAMGLGVASQIEKKDGKTVWGIIIPYPFAGIILIFLAIICLVTIFYTEGYSNGLKENEKFIGCSEINYSAPKLETIEKEKYFGKASFYDYFLDSGWSSRGHYVCATRDFPRYSFIKVTNLDNDKSVICKITDFGPDADIYPERIIDLSSTAFSEIANIKLGVIDVKIETID